MGVASNLKDHTGVFRAGKRNSPEVDKGDSGFLVAQAGGCH